MGEARHVVSGSSRIPAAVLFLFLALGASLARAQWTSSDIGSVGVAGSDSYNSATGVYTLNGSGADIYGTADACHFVYQNLAGDGQLQARVVSMTNTNAAAKAGVMIRQSTSASAMDLAMLETPSTPGLRQLMRTTAGGTTTSAQTSTHNAPYWVRVVKVGNSVISFQSPDGVTWSVEDVATYAWSGPVDLGLVVCSHANTTLCTATFDNITFTAQTSFAPPAPWADADIGGPANAGATQVQEPLWSIYGGGAGLAGSADQFHFVGQPLSGNGVVIAQVNSLGAGAAAGVVIRQDLTAGAAEAGVLGNASGGTSFVTRSAAGAALTTVAGAASGTSWVELARSGNTITGYQSSDGLTWTAIGSQTISLTGTVYVGLAGTSGTNSALAVEALDQVQLWTGSDIGSVGVAGSDSYGSSPGVYTLNGSGADIYGTVDAFHFAGQALSGDAELQARVVSMTNTSSAAKAGVMLRQSTSASSLESAMLETPSAGLRFLTRSTAGGSATSVETSTHGVPYWVRLVRDGNVVSSFQSADGVTWVFAGTTTDALSDPVQFGLAVCSHANTSLCTATFDNIRLSQGLLDTDANGLPDYWEIEYFGGTGAVTGYNANSAPDGNGFTLLQDYQGGANPTNYYSQPGPSGPVLITPTVTILGGNNQYSAPGQFAPQALEVQVNNGGTALSNAPVTFSVASGGGKLSATSGGTASTSVTVAANTAGQAQVYFQQPAGTNIASAITATTGGQTVSFTEADTYSFVTLAGLAGNSGNSDGIGPAAWFNQPSGMAVDAAGNTYVADTDNNTIRKIAPGGLVTTLAGSPGVSGNADGTVGAARFNHPAGLAVDGGGNIYVADSSNNAIRKITPAGVTTTVAGLSSGAPGSANGTGNAAGFSGPGGIAVDASGNLYVADTMNDTLRKITPGGVVTTLAGAAGQAGSADGTGSAARFNHPGAVAVAASGNIYVADTNSSTVRKIASGAVVTTLAGAAGQTGSGDGTGSAARFNYPGGVAVDAGGNIYVADTNNDTIRKIAPGAVVTTLAGLAGVAGFSDGAGTAARFDLPAGIAVDGAGDFYVGDAGNDTARATIPSALTAPVITSATTATGTTGVPFSYTITASNGPTGFSAQGLPAGLTLNPFTGVIAGTPTGVGSFSVTLGAANAGGTGTGNVMLQINAPQMISIAGGNGQTGPAGTYTAMPLQIKVSTAGVGAANAPVTFTVSSGGGGISLLGSGPVQTTIATTTDSSGEAGVYFQMPGTANGNNVITATAGTTTVVTSVSFAEYATPGNAPQVQLTISPSAANAPAAPVLTATISSGTANEVTFYEGGQVLGTVTAAPFTLALQTVSAGVHSYIAVATNSSTGATGEGTVAFNGTVPGTILAPYRYSRPPGTGIDPSFQTFVVALNQTAGTALAYTGNSGYAPGALPWFLRIANAVGYHLAVANGTVTSGGTTYPTQSATYPASQAFQNPVVAFGAAGGGTTLYTNQSYAFGFGSGGQDNSMTTLPDLRIRVFARSALNATQTNVNPVATFTMTLPRQGTADWTTFAQQGFKRTYPLTQNGTTYPLVTTIQYQTGGANPSATSGDNAVQFGSGQSSPFVLTHTATSSAYYYEIDYEGVTFEQVTGTNAVSSPQELWMAMASPGVTPNQYSTANSTGTYSLGYTLDFTDLPQQASTFISQPQFQGQPVPAEYANLSVAELLNINHPVTDQLAGVPVTSALTAIDGSPELRSHPVLDKLVSDLTATFGANTNATAMALANYVLNNIRLTDALSYDRNGNLADQSINCGGVNRGALATYMEQQGNPTEQCALLIYLLRKAGVPCGYVFPANDTLQMLDQRMSSILRMQINNAVDPYGNAIMPAGQIIPVNYPWVAAYVGGTLSGGTYSGGTWVHLFPWLKDTDITEGYDLNPLMPGAGVLSGNSTGYQSGLGWAQNYILRDPNILSLSSQWDDPAHLFVPFIEKELAAYHPAIQIGDVGIQAFDRQNIYTSWAQFPQPWGLNGTLSPANFQPSLAQLDQVDQALTPPVGSIFNTISLTLTTSGNGASASKPVVGIYPVDNGFEEPNVGSSYQFDPPSGSGWTFSGSAGIACSGYAPGATKGQAFDSTQSSLGQAALLYSSGCSFTQVMPLSAGTYSVSFGLEGNPQTGGVSNAVTVTFAGQTVYTGTPSNTTAFTQIVTPPVTVSGIGNTILTFSGTGAAGAESFIDDVMLVPTLTLRAVDLHDRRLMVREVQNTTGSNYTLSLSLAPGRPGTTHLGQFRSSDDMMDKQSLANSALPAGDLVFNIQTTYNRNLNMPNGFVPPANQWNSFLGVYDKDSTTNVANQFFSGDLVTYCLDFGRVTQQMLDLHAQNYWAAQQTVLNGSTAGVDPDDLVGEPVYLMGLTYDKYNDDFSAQMRGLYKTSIVSHLGYGVAKINAARTYQGTLANGVITPLYPAFDVLDDHVTSVAYGTDHADTATVPYAEDPAYVGMVSGSASEHTVINRFFHLTDSASSVHVLDVAQMNNRPIVFLNSQNYAAQGGLSYTAPAIVNGTLSTATKTLSAWAGSYWPGLVANLQGSPYAFAYATPGNVTCANGSFTGMGYLTGDGYGNTASALSVNQQQLPINGGTGPALPSIYDIAFGSGLSLNNPAYWVLTFDGSSYSMSDLAPSLGPIAGFDAGSDATFSLATDDAAIASGSEIEDTYDLTANFNANLQFGYIPANSTLPTTAAAIATQKANVESGGNLGQVFYSALSAAYQVVADPVDVIQGGFHVDESDLTMPGPMPIRWQRHYNSLNQADNELGYGWTSGYEPYLVVAAGSSPIIDASEMDGSVIAYTPQVMNGQTVWSPLPANNPTLLNQHGMQAGGLTNLFNNTITASTVAGVTTYTLTGADGSVRTYVVSQYPIGTGTYAVSRSRPYLTSWQDPEGNKLIFSIGGSNASPDYGKLNRITSSNGNYIQLDYDNFGHVIRAIASDGRQVSYRYNSSGDLVSVTRADGSAVSYAYDSQLQSINGVTQSYSDHLLTQVTKPEGRVLQNFYVQKTDGTEAANPDRRVDHQMSTIGANGAMATSATFLYVNSTNGDGTLTGTTNVTDPLGNTTLYGYSEDEITSITYPAPLNYTILQTWYQTTNASGAYNRSLQQRIDRRGLITKYSYDTSTNGTSNPAGRGNPTEIDTVGDLTGAGTPPEIDTKLVDYNSLNLPIQVTEKNADPTSGNYTTLAYTSPLSPYLCTLVSYNTAQGAISQTSYIYENVGGGAQFADGMLQSVIEAQNTTDSAETDYGYNAQGYVTSETEQTGTSDPAVTTTFSYNPTGEVAQSMDAARRYSNFAYDAMGRVISDEDYDQAGNLLSFHHSFYNQNGELQWTQGPHFNPDDYSYRTYDGAGRLTQVLQYRSQAIPGGGGVEQATGDGFVATTSHVYDNFGNEIVAMDPNGNTVQSPTSAHDVLGRVLSRQYNDSAGNQLATESFTYEPGDKVATQVSAIGGETQYFYTATGQLSKQINPDNSTETWSYQCDGRLHQVTYPNGATRTYVYDDLNRVIRNVYSGGSLSATESETYDRRGNRVASTDADGYTTTVAYDGLDRAKVVTGPPAFTVGAPYNAFEIPAGGGNAQQQITYDYDAAGIEETETNALGEETVTTFDGLHRPIQINIDNAQGQAVRTRTYTYSPDHQYFTTVEGVGTDARTTYTDVQGHPVLEVKADGGIELSAYDSDENLISSTDELNRTTTHLYDGLNREIQEQLPDGAQTTFTYDLANRILTRSMPGGLTWSGAYDTSGRKLSEQLTQGSSQVATRTSQYSYYPTGELHQVVDPRGIVSTYGYDGFDRVQNLAAVDHSSAQLGLTQTYTYDLRGNITELDQTYQNPALSASATQVLRTYDGYGALAEESMVFNGALQGNCVATRDGAGRRTALKFTHAGTEDGLRPSTVGGFTFGYQADGGLTQVGCGGYTCNYTYGTDGLLTSRSTPWSTQNITRNDATGRITEETQSVNGAVALDETNLTAGGVSNWRPDSTQTSCAITRVGGVSETRNYGYDDASGGRGHLLSETFAPTSGASASLSYQFDGNIGGGLGQRTSAGLTGAITGTNNSTYGTGFYGRLTQQSLSGSQLGAAGFSPVNDLYDAAGQLSSHSPGSNADTLTWDALGRLISMQRNPSGNGFTWTAVYDGFGRRLETTQQTITGGAASGPALVTQSVYDPDSEFMEVASTVNGWREWLMHGPDLTGGYDDLEGTGGVDAVVSDPFSTGPAIVTGTGVISDIYGHAEGTITGLAGTGTAPGTGPGPGGGPPKGAAVRSMAASTTPTLTLNWNPVRCTGYGPEPGATAQPLDGVHDLSTLLAWRGKYIDGTGFYYLGNRYYDPSSGTFLSCDPLGHEASADLYSYCDGDPVNNFDPDGRCVESQYNGGAGSAALRGAGSYLDDIADDAPDSSLAFGAGYVSALLTNAGSMTPRNAVDSAFQYGENVASEYEQYGLGTAGEYAATSWNLGAIESAIANVNPVTGDPVGGSLDRWQLALGGVAGTTSILTPVLGRVAVVSTEVKTAPASASTFGGATWTDDGSIFMASTGPRRPPPKLFYNRYKDQCRTPLEIIPPADYLKWWNKNQDLIYVVTKDGELIIGKEDEQIDSGGHHHDLAQNGSVRAAGQVRLEVDGKVLLNNASGHYRPRGRFAQEAAINAFVKAGFPAEKIEYTDYSLKR